MIGKKQIVTVLGLLALCSVASAIEVNDPIAHWKFDEGAGTIAYDSAGDNDGNLVNGPIWTTGQINGALSFDGVNDYVDVGDKDNLDFGAAASFSIAAWVNSNTDTYIDTAIVSKRPVDAGGTFREGYVFKIYADTLDFSIEDTSRNRSRAVGVTPIRDNQWHHVAAVRDTAQDKLYLYLEGVLDATPVIDTTTGTLATSRTFEIGRLPYYPDYFDGMIDDVRVYDRGLSAEEIWQLYQQGTGGPELVALEIIGPEKVAENSVTQYKAIAHYDNNSTRDVTDSAQWFVEPNTVATIDANGLLTTETIFKPRDITIYAEYTEGENTVQAENVVAVFAICPTGSALSFDGVNDYVNMNTTS
ncbi:MAG: LamG domain-containing protein, partial [Sedimentisphaerales bacterium]|nr:LamG domain-containing protein [Sedimentisphaerales bacterium]